MSKSCKFLKHLIYPCLLMSLQHPQNFPSGIVIERNHTTLQVIELRWHHGRQGFALFAARKKNCVCKQVLVAVPKKVATSKPSALSQHLFPHRTYSNIRLKQIKISNFFFVRKINAPYYLTYVEESFLKNKDRADWFLRYFYF